jgi:hypothetical protein
MQNNFLDAHAILFAKFNAREIDANVTSKQKMKYKKNIRNRVHE